jgi:hypothetical protein
MKAQSSTEIFAIFLLRPSSGRVPTIILDTAASGVEIILLSSRLYMFVVVSPRKEMHMISHAVFFWAAIETRESPMASKNRPEGRISLFNAHSSHGGPNRRGIVQAPRNFSFPFFRSISQIIYRLSFSLSSLVQTPTLVFLIPPPPPPTTHHQPPIGNPARDRIPFPFFHPSNPTYRRRARISGISRPARMPQIFAMY